jgi:lipopolysaccharide transport system ATP-binding protein
MSEAIITVENLGKKYRIAHQAERPRYTALRDVIAEKAKRLFSRSQTADLRPPTSACSSSEDFWALKDVSFEVKRGEVVGIIGRNGAGKSTLLKILSRITEPTTGSIRLRGRVASLLEVGTGFHPELTGRENVFLNGAILGMHRAEIKRKFDEIVAFAEVEKFLDTPVKRYSSGMYVRLAFAVAAHLEPEILIVDEVLAVGDAQFQKKCLGKMGEVAKGGRTVLFVSHNMGVVSTLTQRCIYLQDGQIAASGNSRDIVEMYLRKSAESQSTRIKGLESYRRKQNSDVPVKIISIGANGSNGLSDILPSIEIGTDFSIEIGLDVTKPLHGATLDITLKTGHGVCVAVMFSKDQDYNLFLEPGRHTVSVKVCNLPLAPSNYFVDVGVNQSDQSAAFDVILDYPILTIVNNGQVTHWLDRPWGALHTRGIIWSDKLNQNLPK